MNIVLVDCETTGLDSQKHDIIELGFIIFCSETFKVYGKFNFKIKPERIEDANPRALEVNGYSKKDWKDAISAKEALTFFADASQGCHFMAHNCPFDWSFVEAALKKYDIPHTLNYHKLDTLSIAWSKIPHDKLQSWSLKTICTYLKIPPEPKVHRALNGAECAYQVYKKLMQ